MNYSCLVVDDEPLAQELIVEHVSKIPRLNMVGICNNAIEASSVITAQKVDLLFLDINMPLMKGVDFVKNLLVKPKVIFTTAHREYALEGFEVNAIDYLLKPIVFDRFFLAVQKFFQTVENTPEQEAGQLIFAKNSNLFVTQGHRKLRVDPKGIRYVESFKDYILIHTENESIRTKENIGNFEKKLGPGFLRIHRSYLAQVSYISGYTKHDIEIGTRELPIGSSYKAGVLDFLDRMSNL